MSQSSSGSSLRSLFNAALQDYATKTGTKMDDHPLFTQLETCDSVDSISSVLQGQAARFHEFRGKDGKITKSLACTIHILYMLSTSTLSEGISSLCLPARAVFAAFGILLGGVKDVSASYDTLLDLLQTIERFLSRLNIYTRIPLTPAMSNVVVKIMVEILSTLALATKQVKQGRLKKFVKKVFGEDEIEAVLHRLDRLTQDEARATGAQTLEVVCGLVQHRRVVMDELDDKSSVHNLQEALELMHKTLSNINKSKRGELQQNIHKWLSPPDPWKNHNIARESRHGGTGAWWIHGKAFSQWKYSGPSSLLWVHGKPGAGKSVLSSSIIQDIRDMCASGLATLAFFYCDFREDQKKERRGLLSSLLVQLCYQSDAYSAALSDFYSIHGRGSHHASDSELMQCLKDLLGLPGQATVYAIIDALDECPAMTGFPSHREQVLELVEELVRLQIANLRICITSRPEADIEHVLGPLAFQSVSLHSERGQAQDIAEYIRFAVNTDRKMGTWRRVDKELVIDVLMKKADGMFRWAFCQLEHLRHGLRQRIRQALEELPETLDETYDRILEDISKQNWKYAHRLLQCVSVASRPLRVKELAEFLAFDYEAESTPTLQVDWREENPAHAVLSTCSSLLAIVDVDGSPVVQFSHFSVKEYLTSKRLAESKDTISRFHVSMTLAHTIVAQACLGTLLHIEEYITENRLNSFPLAEYAARHWVGHARFEGVSPSIQDGMKGLFDPNNCHLAVWTWIYDPESRIIGHRRSERPSQAWATPLHYAALYGLHEIAKFLIVERSQDVNAPGFRNAETPLLVASRKGHSDVARVLLEHGADPEIRNNSTSNLSPLDQASKMGHVEVAQVLLELGADVNAPDLKCQNWVALHVASSNGQPEVARVLLEYGADVNAKDSDEMSQMTPLHEAHNEEVARVLLEYGADMNAQSPNYHTPFYTALREGRVGVARLLLEYGADVSAPDSQLSSSRSDYHELVRLLLQPERSSRIHARDDTDQIPAPSTYGHNDVMLLLLQRWHEAEEESWGAITTDLERRGAVLTTK